VKIAQSLLHHGSDYTPYEGLEVTGWPVATMVRGRVVVRDGVLAAAERIGEHVTRDRSPFAEAKKSSLHTKERTSTKLQS
jgi:dihydropyrimidinase